jgi:lipid II:glycine glycyltransferase (peptidoglycan interpeptide bridge formation enzyme)
MLIRALREEEKDLYNQVVSHPLQSWQWGEFRRQTGVKVERIGFFDQGKLHRAIQVTFHPLPLIGKTAGYLPKADAPDEDQLAALKQLGQNHQALFVKLEPNLARPAEFVPIDHSTDPFTVTDNFLTAHDCVSGKPLFTKYTFNLDLTPAEDQLFANLSSKTRYNVNIAIKKGVTIYENTSLEGMEQYLEILAETTQRQGFYAHSPSYFRQMWETLGKSGMLRIFHAVYEDTILVSWIMFVFNGVLYYPYGASRSANRDVMASNLMMWEMIKWGKAQGCKSFDMWGSLGPNPDEKSPWFGFHRFKKGYGGQLQEFLGTYDFVLDFPIYKLFRLADDLRWKLLRLKTKLAPALDPLLKPLSKLLKKPQT